MKNVLKAFAGSTLQAIRQAGFHISALQLIDPDFTIAIHRGQQQAATKVD
jgi:hypothetical protein